MIIIIMLIIIAIAIFIVSFVFAISDGDTLSRCLATISGGFLLLTFISTKHIEIGRYKVSKIYEATNMSASGVDYIVETSEGSRSLLPRNKVKHRLNKNAVLIINDKRCLFGSFGESEISYILER